MSLESQLVNARRRLQSQRVVVALTEADLAEAIAKKVVSVQAHLVANLTRQRSAMLQTGAIVEDLERACGSPAQLDLAKPGKR